MFNKVERRHLLYLVTALLLLMQSFAIWHDAEHAFHNHDEQCERFEAFANSPALDIVSQPIVVAIASYQLDVTAEFTTPFFARQYKADAIRAPPQLLS